MIQPPLLDLPEGIMSGAVLSPCGTYRYTLDRVWDPARPHAVFIMLNSSTADHEIDDPTARRCTGFAKREGCGSFTAVNLFALRSADPKALTQHPDPVGPENDFHLLSALTKLPKVVIAAWGAHPFATARAQHVQDLLADPLAELKLRLLCLGVTKDGHPRHPLYVKGDAPLIPLRKAA